MNQSDSPPQAESSQDWLWNIVLCPECGGSLNRNENSGAIICENEQCGYSSYHRDGVINLLPRHLDAQQMAEDEFRRDILDTFDRSVRKMTETQQETYTALNTATYYAFTSQYAFFRDYFTKKFKLAGRGLEIGGASGQSSGFIKLFYPDIEIITSDVAPINMILAERLARQLNFETDYFVMADAINPPFAPNSFDFIFSSGMLHHLGDLGRALERGHALLKPEGRWYIINELSIGSLPRAFWNSPWGEKGKWAQQTGIRENSYTLKEWLRFFDEAGFNVVDIHFHTDPNHKLLSWIRATYYALISVLPTVILRMGIPCEVNFVLEKK